MRKQFGNFFVQFNPLIHVRNEFNLSDQFRAALRNAVPFAPNTRYGLDDDGIAQAALAYQAGVAVRALHSAVPGEAEKADPRRSGTTALYVGAGPKYLMGLAYGEITSNGGVTTADTLFGSSNPVAVDLTGNTRPAAVGTQTGMGHGYGVDLGTVLFWKNLEVGLGVSDVGSRIHWSTTRNLLAYDDSLNEFTSIKQAKGEGFWSTIPYTATLNVAKRIGPSTFAVDVVKNELFTGIHAGAETWFGPLAVRAAHIATRTTAGNSPAAPATDSAGSASTWRWERTSGTWRKRGRWSSALPSRSTRRRRCAAPRCSSFSRLCSSGRMRGSEPDPHRRRPELPRSRRRIPELHRTRRRALDDDGSGEPRA